MGGSPDSPSIAPGLGSAVHSSRSIALEAEERKKALLFSTQTLCDLPVMIGISARQTSAASQCLHIRAELPGTLGNPLPPKERSCSDQKTSMLTCCQIPSLQPLMWCQHPHHSPVHPSPLAIGAQGSLQYQKC